MNLEQARSIVWPFMPLKGEKLGSLIDSKQLSLKDLGWAAENAWDPKIRQAAIALSLAKLDQVQKAPVPDAGFVKIVSGGRSFAERQQSFLTLLDGMVLGVPLSVIIALVVWLVSSAPKSQGSGRPIGEVISTPTGIFGLIIALLLGALILWLVNFIPDQISKRLNRKINEYRRGEEGEEQVLHQVVQALDGNWSVFRNVKVPGRYRGDLDLVLVGPPGVWVLEVKNWNGAYRNIGNDWSLKKGIKWKAAYENPSDQARINAGRLGGWLEADHLKVFVKPAVVWANPQGTLSVDNPSVAVWKYAHLADELGNIWQRESLSKAERNKINDKLTLLCERERMRQEQQQ